MSPPPRRGARPLGACAGAMLALLALALTASVAHAGDADPPVSADVDLVVDPALREVRGEVLLRLRNPGREVLDHVLLWRFPETLSRLPEGMDEVVEPRMFPEGFSPGGMQLEEIRDARGRRLDVEDATPTLARVALAHPLAPGEVATLRIRFVTTVPHRFGPFGHAEQQITLDGGFFPRPPPLDEGGFAPHRPPDRIAWSLRVRWPGPREGVVVANGRVRSLEPHGRVADLGSGEASRVSLVVMTEVHRSHLDVDGVRVRLLHRRPRRALGGRRAIVDLGFVDVHAQMLATVGSAMRFLRALDLPAPDRVVVVETPIRRDVAVAASDMVLVSDRAFDVTPFEPLRKFHRLPVVRAALAVALRSRVAPSQPPARRAQVVDLVASDLTCRWEALHYGGHRTARDLLAKGSFVAEVDEVLNAPQIPFESTYFRSPDDTDRFRDRFTLFSHRRPVGRLWRERLRDRCGDATLGAVVRDLAEGSTSLEDALEKHGPCAEVSWLQRWNRGIPEVNYRLGPIRSGRDDVGPWLEVEVLREGREPVDEPVTVRLEEGGRILDHTVFVTGDVTTVRFRTSMEDPEITIDPGYRLVESDLGRPVDPRFDNVRRPDWRFLVAGLSVGLNTATGRVNTALLSSLRRQHDATNIVLLSAFDTERRSGVSGTWLRGFGRKIVPNRRRFAWGTGVTTQALKPAEGDSLGVGLRASVSLRELTYVSRTDPREGVWRQVRAGPTLSVRDGETRVGGFVGLRLARLIRVGWAHTFAGQLRFDTLLGDVPGAEDWPVGGVGAVRAFSTFARSGRHRTLASLEWRHRYSRSLAVDVGHLAWIEGIDGVLFVDGALLADTYDDLFEQEAVSLGAGYGLRIHYLLAGLDPITFGVDVGIPILAAGRFGAGDGPPWSVVFAIGQAF
ncbi:MAG: hypothetical protein ACQEXJ_17170 [Myxococcota bacterium]